MDKNMLQYYRIIGEIQSIIAKSDTLEEALKNGLKCILDRCKAEYAIVWYRDKQDVLHPYYWICPIDFTTVQYASGEGIVGHVYQSENPARLLNYKEKPDASTDRDFCSVSVSSLICVPISDRTETIGCMEFIRTEGMFTEEEADVCELLATMASLEIEDNEKIKGEWNVRKAVLSVRDIRKSFKNGDTVTHVLKGINLDIYEGEFLVLLGESGCGKSTLLNITSGMENADSGTITFMGEDISHATQDELTRFRRDNIGFIFQSYNLMPNLNVKQNLQLIAELVKAPRDIDETIELVGLSAKKTNYPSQLSGGQQQRVSIARALIKDPRLIMADEPTAALDYETSIEVLSALEEVLRKGTTLVMVTHNEEITRMADRVVRLRNGRIYEVTVNRHPVHATDLVW